MVGILNGLQIILMLHNENNEFKEYYNRLHMIKLLFDMDINIENNNISPKLAELRKYFKNYKEVFDFLNDLLYLQNNNCSSCSNVYYYNYDEYNNNFGAENLFLIVAHKLTILKKMFKDNEKLLNFLRTKTTQDRLYLIEFVLGNTPELLLTF